MVDLISKIHLEKKKSGCNTYEMKDDYRRRGKAEIHNMKANLWVEFHQVEEDDVFPFIAYGCVKRIGRLGFEHLVKKGGRHSNKVIDCEIILKKRY